MAATLAARHWHRCPDGSACRAACVLVGPLRELATPSPRAFGMPPACRLPAARTPLCCKQLLRKGRDYRESRKRGEGTSSKQASRQAPEAGAAQLSTVYSAGGGGGGGYTAAPRRRSEPCFFGRLCAIFLAPLKPARREWRWQQWAWDGGCGTLAERLSAAGSLRCCAEPLLLQPCCMVCSSKLV